MTTVKLPCRRFLDLAAGAAALAFMVTALPRAGMAGRPVTIVVGTAAGGGADLLARVVAGRLSELLGRPFVVGNARGSGQACGNCTAQRIRRGLWFRQHPRHASGAIQKSILRCRQRFYPRSHWLPSSRSYW